jgi:hypothetical protein
MSGTPYAYFGQFLSLIRGKSISRSGQVIFGFRGNGVEHREGRRVEGLTLIDFEKFQKKWGKF